MYRKQLLNKCQEEFEKGAAAMEAVEARERAEQARTQEEREQDQAEVTGPLPPPSSPPSVQTPLLHLHSPQLHLSNPAVSRVHVHLLILHRLIHIFRWHGVYGLSTPTLYT